MLCLNLSFVFMSRPFGSSSSGICKRIVVIKLRQKSALVIFFAHLSSPVLGSAAVVSGSITLIIGIFPSALPAENHVAFNGVGGSRWGPRLGSRSITAY